MTTNYQSDSEANYQFLVQKLQEKREKVFNINNYVQDGFVRVCEVDPRSPYQWAYKNIDRDVMYSAHNSWVYFIVLDEIIQKVGETEQPLGIKASWGYHDEPQPVTGTTSRLGRLRKGDGTDHAIRRALAPAIQQGLIVSVWARACSRNVITESVGGKSMSLTSAIHKDLEKAYLDYFYRECRMYPPLNKMRK